MRQALLLLVLCLTACAPELSASPVTYCPTPIHPDDETRTWLKTLNPPPSAVHYFNQIANQQQLFDRRCK